MENDTAAVEIPTWEESKPVDSGIFPLSGGNWKALKKAFSGDPLGFIDDAQTKADLHFATGRLENPDLERKKWALAAYFARMRREDVRFCHGNIDSLLERWNDGKPMSVDAAYNDIASVLGAREKEKNGWESALASVKSGFHKQNASIWNMIGTIARGQMEQAGVETFWLNPEAAEMLRDQGIRAQKNARKEAKVQEALAQEEAGYADMNPEWFTKSEGIGDWLRNAGLMILQTSPQLLTQAGAAAVSAGGSLALIGAYTANDKYYELSEENPEMGAVNMAANVVGTALINAALEKVSVGIISGKLSEKVAKEGIKSGAKEIFKYFGLAFAEEAASEGLEQFAENALDIITGAKDKELAEGASVGQLLMAGVGESAIVGGISGVGFAGVGFKGLRDYSKARDSMIGKLEAEAERLAKIENPSDEEVKLLKTCQTALESGDVDSMVDVGMEIRIRNEADKAKRKADAEDMTPEEEALAAKRNNALRNGVMRHDPQETHDAVYQAAQSFENVQIEAISGAEALTADAKAEAVRLGIDPAKIRAWYSPKDDKIYINAARVRPSEVPYLLLHEAAVHKGLPAVLGKEYDPVMDSIYGQFREEIEAVNELYHYDLDNENERRAATEEYLAERAEFCGHDWRAYAKEHEEEIERYIAENGLSRENRKGAVRGLMEENGELEMRPSRWKEFLQRVKMFFRKWKGFENYRFTDREIETLIMRGLRRAQGRSSKLKVESGKFKVGSSKFAVAPVWTGSAADYEKPSLHYVGSGEGAQVYGWGLYGSSSEKVARWYAEVDAERKNHPRIFFDGEEFNPDWYKRDDVYMTKEPTEYELRNTVLEDVFRREGSWHGALSYYRVMERKARDGMAKEPPEYYVALQNWIQKNHDRIQYRPKLEKGLYINGENVNVFSEKEKLEYLLSKILPDTDNREFSISDCVLALQTIIRDKMKNGDIHSAAKNYNGYDFRWPERRNSLRKAAEFIANLAAPDGENGNKITWIDDPINGKRNLYQQTFWPDKQENLLDWDKNITDEQAQQILDRLAEEGGKEAVAFVNREREDWQTDPETGEIETEPEYYAPDVLRDYLDQFLDFYEADGKYVYKQLTDVFGSPKAASEFLHRAGIDGVTYIGMDSGRRNYVAFSDEDIRVDEHVRFSLVEDPETLNRLNKAEWDGEYLTLYRAAQLVDGKLYPPMAAKINGKWVDPIVLGKWEQADEHPELASDDGYFRLNKGNGSSVDARYNPYFHSSPTPLNDQFASAYKRPELVTLEVRVPKSELASGYHADKAKDSVGMKQWKAGVVQGKLGGTRQVMLSRWDKPIRIIPDNEVAAKIAEMLKGKDVVIPENVVTPNLRAELEKAGVEVEEKGNGDIRFAVEDEESGYAFPLRTENTYSEVLKILKGISEKPLHNAEYRIDAKLSVNGINKILSNTARKKSIANGFTDAQHLQAAANIDRLFKNGVLIEDRPDKNNDPNIKSIKRFAAPFFTGEDFAEARITLKESIEAGHRIYSLELDEIRKPSDVLGGEPDRTPRPSDGPRSVSSTDAIKQHPTTEGYNKLLQKIEKARELLKKVFGNDKPDMLDRQGVEQTETEEFKRWFGDSKAVDDDGKPLVVYRRDDEEYTIFDFNKTQKNDAGWLGKGFYFYGDRLEAERAYGYGQKLRSFYLRAENPYYISNEEYNELVDADDPQKSAEFTERLKAEGYDSVYWNGDMRQEWAVFEPNQIKSATDNIGTFDPKNPDIRFSVESYSEEDWADMVTFLKPYVGQSMEQSDADYLKHLRDNGFEVANEEDAYHAAAEARKANQRDAHKRSIQQRNDWLYDHFPLYREAVDFCGTTDFIIKPAYRFAGQKFTGSWISPEFVKYSEKRPQRKDESDASYRRYLKHREKALANASGQASDELAEAIGRKWGRDALDVEQELLDFFGDLKKRRSKAEKENGQLGLFDQYSEWKASSPLLNAQLDEKLMAEWEAEKQARLEEDFISLIEHGTQIDAEWVTENRELWEMLCKRFLSKEAPYRPSKKDLEALNAALHQEGSDAASYAKGWADAKAQLIDEKRKEFREFREKVLSSKAEALKLQDEALAFARKHLPNENQGEFAQSILALMRIDNTPTKKHPEGKRKEALEKLFERILARAEDLRRKELLEDFEKRMKQMGMRADGSGKLIGRSDPETQAQIEQIIEAVKLDPDEVIMRTEELTAKLESLRDSGEDALEIETELAILDRYGALYHKDLADLEDACRSFRALSVTGRNKLKERIEQRAMDLEGKRNHIEDLVSRGEVSPQERRKKHEKWKAGKITRAIGQSFWEMNSLDSLLSYQNRPGESDRELRSLQERINRADEDGKTLNRKNADALIEEINRLFNVKNRYDRATVLMALRERNEKTGVFRKQAKADEKKFEYRKITPEEAEELLRDYDNGGKLLNDYEAEALRHQMRTRKYRMERKQSDYFRDGVTDPVINEMMKRGDKDKEGMYYIPSIKFSGTRVEESLTQMEALYLRLLWDQKDVRYKLRFNGWDEQSIAGLDAFLKPEVKSLGKWFVEQLDADRAGIGKVYEQLYFSRFPHEENYFPTVYDTSREGLDGRITVDLTQEGAGAQPMSCTPGAVKLRRFHLQEPKIADALTIFTNHRMMMNHFVSHAEAARELRGLYLSKRVSEALRDVYGIDYYNTLKKEIADFIHGGNADVRNNIVFTHLLNNWTRIKMLWNIGSGVKQMFGGVSYMKYGDIPASAMAHGIADFWKHPAENAKHLMETEYFKNRWQGGMNREMRSLMDSTGLNSGKLQTLFRDLDSGGFFFLRFGDAFSVIAYGHAVYKYHYDKLLKEGMSKADAERGALAEWRMATERTQQSGNVSMLNSWQKGSSTQKLFTNFLSNPILLCQSHSRDIYNAVMERHKGSAISAAQKLMVSGLVSVIMAAISSLWRHGVNFDKYELGDFSFEALSDAVCGIPAIGPYMTAVFNALNGGREKSIPVLDDISRSVRSGYRIAEDFDRNEIDEDTMKDVITILQGMGLISAPAAQSGSIMREIRRIVKLTEEE